MQTLLLTAAVKLVRLYLGAGAFDRIAAMVARLRDAPRLSGAEKRAEVLRFAETELRVLAKYAVAAAIELLLAQRRAA